MEGDVYCVNDPTVISEVIDGETIVLNFDNGHYYSLNAVASEIWARVSAGNAVAAAAEGVAQRFGVEPVAIRAQVVDFIERLEEERLIRRVDATSAAPVKTSVACVQPAGAFAPPAFEKFTDMEELLLLDPIHEVSDSGWPRRP